MWTHSLIIAAVVVLAISFVMSITGRGGGNFYVPVLVACGLGMLEAATTAQCILFFTALVASLVFYKNKTVDWKLALVIDTPTNIMAFFGGFYAHMLPEHLLKYLFAGLLVLTSIWMLRPVRNHPIEKKRFGFWRRKFGDYVYNVNLWLAIPVTAATGFIAGMIGISGGSFKVPLMVLACGVPMRIAVGTSSLMVAATALMGFLGHCAGGDLNLTWIIPLVAVAVAGGFLGGKFSISIKPESLKKIFAYTTLVAAGFMIFSAFIS